LYIFNKLYYYGERNIRQGQPVSFKRFAMDACLVVVVVVFYSPNIAINKSMLHIVKSVIASLDARDPFLMLYMQIKTTKRASK